MTMFAIALSGGWENLGWKLATAFWDHWVRVSASLFLKKKQEQPIFGRNSPRVTSYLNKQ
jgi:hypothetical protein